jgi:hypothetical protein
MIRTWWFAGLWLLVSVGSAVSQPPDAIESATLWTGKTALQNALWGENPKTKQFTTSRRVVVAEIEGPAIITMIHFALPAKPASPSSPEGLGRDLLLRIYWDGERDPSVDSPLVDFFCDPAGLRGTVNTALVNKNRGFNAYFAMPFRKSARVELVYDGPVEPGKELWSMMPCYSYVSYRTLEKLPENVGYFHAHWRQELLLLGKHEYTALEAQGNGKFIGWSVTVRQPGRPKGYPVDENEKFFIDGQSKPAIEYQGLEDSFGFSWGFPPKESFSPQMGWFPFKDGASAYRFFINDAIRFEKSLRVTIGFGANENPMFTRQYGYPGSELEFSTVCFWYQTEPHASYPAMPPADARRPSPPLPNMSEVLPTAEELRARRVRLEMRCGRPEKELLFAETGFGANVKGGFTYNGFPGPVSYCRADAKELQVVLSVPKGSAGMARLFVTDPDQYQGGRKQEVFVAGQSLGVVQHFDDGKWLEQHLTPQQTAEGQVSIRIVNRREEANAVISIVQWVEDK